MHTGLEKKKNSLCFWSFLSCLVIFKMPHFRHCWALFWPYVEQFSPSQISFHDSKKCCNILVWRFCQWNMKKWKGLPLGLIIFLLFNKYLGIRSVLESKRRRTYAGHLSTLMGNSILLYQLQAHCIRWIRIHPPLAALTRKEGSVSPATISFWLTGIITSGDNWPNPFLAITCIIFFVHEKTASSARDQ